MTGFVWDKQGICKWDRGRKHLPEPHQCPGGSCHLSKFVVVSGHSPRPACLLFGHGGKLDGDMEDFPKADGDTRTSVSPRETRLLSCAVWSE
jgi:hypothetical protein